jgi:septum site-determining protein MinC
MNTQSNKPIEIKISTVVAVSAILRVLDLPTLDAAMRTMTGGAADYFDNEFAVLDVSACDSCDTYDWAALTALFRFYRLNPVAVRGAPDAMERAIVASGLSIDTLIQRQERPVQTAKEPATPLPSLAPAAPHLTASTLIVDTPVRAGQRIYARGADLVVTAAVNNGAELIADGSIHVYAPLRGRALAGASGNSTARIFALCLEAELVSIAGVYRTFDSGLPAELVNKPVQVKLAGDRIDVAPIRN